MFGIFKKTLEKTTQNIRDLLKKEKKKLSKEALEEILIATDMDYELVEMILSPLAEEVNKNELEVALLRLFRGESYYDKVQAKVVDAKPCVDLIVGVNGAGKTTTIATDKGQNKIYDVDEKTKKVVYTAVVKNIPENENESVLAK